MRLHLGCGAKILKGYVNVDKSGTPDVLHDLEQLPWPWLDDSVEEIRMIHVMEHLGRDTSTFLNIIKELYRVCRHGAVIAVIVPHPRHDSYLADPTHVRPILEQTIHLFSREKNLQYRAEGSASSCLALELGVDLELENVIYHFDELWKNKLRSGLVTPAEVFDAALDRFNVIESLELTIRVIKSEPPAAAAPLTTDPV